MAEQHNEIMVLKEMIDTFDVEQPARGRETTAFIKRFRKKELGMPHRGPTHLSKAVNGINAEEIESIRSTKFARDDPRDGNNHLERLKGVRIGS